MSASTCAPHCPECAQRQASPSAGNCERADSQLAEVSPPHPPPIGCSMLRLTPIPRSQSSPSRCSRLQPHSHSVCTAYAWGVTCSMQLWFKAKSDTWASASQLFFLGNGARFHSALGSLRPHFLSASVPRCSFQRCQRRDHPDLAWKGRSDFGVRLGCRALLCDSRDWLIPIMPS